MRMLACVVMLLLAGCSAKQEATESGENPLKPNPAGGPAQGVVRRGAQRQVNQQLLRDVGQYYELFRTEHGRPPKDLAEFQAYVKSDPNARNVAKTLEDGWVVMNLTPNPGSKVLAYEKEPFEKFNNRLVLFQGGAVQLMNEADFQAALRGQ